MTPRLRLAAAALLTACMMAIGLAVWEIVHEQATRQRTTVIALRPIQEATFQPTASPLPSAVRLNFAGRGELAKLPGISEKLADEIIARRTLRPFLFIEELKVIPGIGDKKVDALRPYIILP